MSIASSKCKGHLAYPELNDDTRLLLNSHLGISQLPQLDLVVSMGIGQLLLCLPHLRMLHAQLALLLPGISELGVRISLCKQTTAQIKC